MRIGMTLADVKRVLGAALQLDSPDAALCRYGVSPEIGGVRVMIENGRAARIELQEGWEVTTDKGLGFGSTPEEVRAAYGAALQEGRHKYQDPPAAYLEAWNTHRSRGIRYQIDEQGQVAAVYAGGPAVRYVEGCA